MFLIIVYRVYSSLNETLVVATRTYFQLHSSVFVGFIQQDVRDRFILKAARFHTDVVKDVRG